MNYEVACYGLEVVFFSIMDAYLFFSTSIGYFLSQISAYYGKISPN